MDDNIKDQKISILIIMVSGIVSIIALSLLVLLWTTSLNNALEAPQEESQANKDYPLGEFGLVSVSTSEQIAKYGNIISTYLGVGDYESLYNYVDQEYIEEYNLTVEGLKSLLESKGILNKNLVIEDYQNTTFDNEKIYRVNIVSSDNNSISDYLIIKEKSPGDFSISFDEFVGIDKSPQEFVRDELQITVTNQKYYTTHYSATLKIKNNSQSNIILNYSNSYDPVYVMIGSNSEERNRLTTFGGAQKVLEPNTELNFNVDFIIPDLSYTLIRGFRIKDVYIEKSQNTKTIEFEIE